MPDKENIVVLKFGSSVLRSEKDLPRAVHEIYRWWRDGAKVFAIVSAFGDTTDRLKRQADEISGSVDPSIFANLLATGEAASTALLGLSLNKFGIPTRVFDAVQAGLRTVGEPLDARLVSADRARLYEAASNGVVVLPGFVGRDEHDQTTLLGRGGSDYSALFLAQQLSAHCVLLKDVDGLYTSDPSSNSQRAIRFAKVSYDSAIRLGGALVQQKAIQFAAEHHLRFTVTRIGERSSTEVGPFNDRLATPVAVYEPLRVTLLGCGTVGGGVYQALTELPDLFSIVGVGARNLERARQLGVPELLCTTDLEGLLEKPCDVVVELIGGTSDAVTLITRALQLGRDVVTANKALIALEGDSLHALAQRNGVRLSYSAAVGGVVPAIETIRRLREFESIRGFSGVLNATSNFVIDRVAEGHTLDLAITVAQERGYAEADPRFDLDGTDAAQKLIILAREGFGVSLQLDEIERKGIDELKTDDVLEARKRGQTIRLVASCHRVSGRFKAEVRPVVLPVDHPLSHVAGTQNRLVVETENGKQVIVSGEGAGRWPTAEAVIADLLDLRIDQAEAELVECVA